MADWRSLAEKLALADRRVDAKEAQIIREELFADGRVDKHELEFLIAVRRGAQSVVEEFDELVFRTIKPLLFKDGAISAAVTKWLKGLLTSDGVIDERERRFLMELKRASNHHSAEFLGWCGELGI